MLVVKSCNNFMLNTGHQSFAFDDTFLKLGTMPNIFAKFCFHNIPLGCYGNITLQICLTSFMLSLSASLNGLNFVS